MDARQVVNFFKTKAGVFLLLSISLLTLLWVVPRNSHSKPAIQQQNLAANSSIDTNLSSKSSTAIVETHHRRTSGIATTKVQNQSSPSNKKEDSSHVPKMPIPRQEPESGLQLPFMHIALSSDDVHPVESSHGLIQTEQQQKQQLNPLSSSDSSAVAGPTHRPVRHVSQDYIPYGKLVKCELVFTVDSSNVETPVIGQVMEDLWMNGRLLIPAGTTVHGSASVLRDKHRIPTNDRWILVLPAQGDRPNGAELTVRGVALDRNENDTQGASWAMDDGAFGLKGYAIYTNNMDSIRKYLATFTSALAAGIQTTQQVGNSFTGLNTVVKSTPRNAALAGVSAVLADEAARIQREIDEKGFYIRVPGGKKFYLYLQQTLDMKDARIGDSQAYITPVLSEDESNARINAGMTSSIPTTLTGLAPNYQPQPNQSPILSPATNAFNRYYYGGTVSEQSANGSVGSQTQNPVGLPAYAYPSAPGYTYSYPTGVVPIPQH